MTLVSRQILALGAVGALVGPTLLSTNAPDDARVALEAAAPASAPATEAAHAAAHPGHAWEISVTNITRGQIFSPPVVALHSSDMAPLWTLGSAASNELAQVAEDAINQPLVDAIRGTGHAGDVQVLTGANGPILPGETASIVLRAPRGAGHGWFRNRFDHLSMAGMLVITNDAFFGLNGVELPRSAGSFRSPAYDAGSEENNELCAFIPGPPCNSGGVRATQNAEGFVHVHAGIHGIGDLSAAAYDWRNNVAQIRVRRVR